MSYNKYQREYLGHLLYNDYVSNLHSSAHNASDRSAVYDLFEKHASTITTQLCPTLVQARLAGLNAQKWAKSKDENLAKMIEEYVEKTVSQYFEYKEETKRRAQIVRQRLDNLREWKRGGSLHPYKTSHEFASALAKDYIDDVEFLLKVMETPESAVFFLDSYKANDLDLLLFGADDSEKVKPPPEAQAPHLCALDYLTGADEFMAELESMEDYRSVAN